MQEFYNLGITDEDIVFMIEKCNDIVSITEKEVNEKIQMLEFIGCNEKQINNIIITNPNYLNIDNKDVIDLINKLKNLGIKNINLLFDSNPYFLNKDVFEIEDYINDRLEKKECLEDIIEDIENNPYIIEEY